MLEQPMMDKLAAMRLHGMMESLQQQQKDAGIGELSFLERLAMLVDHQWNWRQNQALARRLQAPSCAATRAWRISISAPRADWTRA